PDLFIVYVGWNDLYTTAPDSRKSAAPDSELVAGRMERLLMRLPLFRLTRRLIFVEAKRAVMKRDATIEKAHIVDYQPRIYEQNLRAMVELAREKRVGIVFLTLTSAVGPSLSEAGIKRIHLPFFTSSVGDFAALVTAYNQSIMRIGKDMAVPIIDM